MEENGVVGYLDDTSLGEKRMQIHGPSGEYYVRAEDHVTITTTPTPPHRHKLHSHKADCMEQAAALRVQLLHD
jgi:hypothetical protein